MRHTRLIFLGGGLGACLRAVLLAWLAPSGVTGPVLLVNLLGAFALGVVFVLADEAGLLRVRTRLFLAVGVLGGFTTFSTFGWGIDTLLAQHAVAVAFGYLMASIGGGVAAVAAGQAVGRQVVAALERAAITVLRRLDQHGLRRIPEARTAMASIEAEDRDESA